MIPEPVLAAAPIPLKNVAKPGKLKAPIMPVGLIEPLTVPEFASILTHLEPLKKLAMEHTERTEAVPEGSDLCPPYSPSSIISLPKGKGGGRHVPGPCSSRR